MMNQEHLTSLSKLNEMYPEDLVTQIQKLTSIVQTQDKTIARLRKLLYISSTQNQPSTGQPMSEEKFYETMGWVERVENGYIGECEGRSPGPHL